jgi:hypothetical protein
MARLMDDRMILVRTIKQRLTKAPRAWSPSMVPTVLLTLNGLSRLLLKMCAIPPPGPIDSRPRSVMRAGSGSSRKCNIRAAGVQIDVTFIEPRPPLRSILAHSSAGASATSSRY